MAPPFVKLPVSRYRRQALSQTSPDVGSLIAGRYLLVRQLGEGGMGTVWEATHTVTLRSVAMKFLKDAACHAEDQRKRFLREASTASALQHPNVVEILDFFDYEAQVP